MFCKFNEHHRLEEFERGATPNRDELIVYTWKDATLAELSGLIQEVIPDCGHAGTQFSFRAVYKDYNHASSGQWRQGELGRVTIGSEGRDDLKTLKYFGFVTGDFIDVAIYPSDHRVRQDTSVRFNKR